MKKGSWCEGSVVGGTGVLEGQWKLVWMEKREWGQSQEVRKEGARGVHLTGLWLVVRFFFGEFYKHPLDFLDSWMWHYNETR